MAELKNLVPIELDATPTVAKSTSENAAALTAKAAAIMDGIEKVIQEKEAARAAEISKLPPDARRVAQNIDQRVHNSLRSDLKREAIKTNEGEIRKMMDALHDRVAKLETASQLVGAGPETLLTTVGMTGSERSGVLFAQVNAAPHAMLTAMARQAIAASDVEMGALISMRLAAMPVKERPITPQELGKALVGDRHAALRRTIDTALADARDGLAAAGRFLVGRKETPVEKLQRGLRQRQNTDPVDARAGIAGARQ